MIKQLQANQLAITNNLNWNRLAIEEGFDKLDDVKRWEMQQLPGFEAIKDSQEFDGDSSPAQPSTEEEIAATRPKPPIPPKPKILTLTDGDLNNYLNNKESVDVLEDFNLTLPYKLKDASLSEVYDEMDKASKQITEQAKKKNTK